MQSFLEAVADALDVPEIGPDAAFRSVPGWCSLKAFGLMVMLENDWHTPLTVDAFRELRTVRDLYRATQTKAV